MLHLSTHQDSTTIIQAEQTMLYLIVNLRTNHVLTRVQKGCLLRNNIIKSKKIAQVVSAWIKSKNSLVKHFEDMRLYRPSKEYLQTEGNVEFHAVIDFLRRSYIYRALIVSPVVSTTFVEQFWTSAKSKTINNVRYITAKVAGKLVSISEASIRTDLLFDDADGIDTLPNQAIFNAIQLMGYEGDLSVLTFNKALFSPQWRFPKKSFSKKQRVHKKHVSKQGRKKAKGESSVQRDPMFEVLAEDKIDQDAQTEGKTRDMVGQCVSIDFEKVSTDRPKVSTDESKVSTDDQVESTDESKESTEEIFEGSEDQREGTEDKVSTDEKMEGTKDQSKEENASKASQTSTQTPTSMTFGDDENNLPRPTSQKKTLQRLILKTKGRRDLKRMEESGKENIQEDWEEEEERSKDYVDDQQTNKKDSSKGEEIKQESKLKSREEDKGRKEHKEKKAPYKEKDLKVKKKEDSNKQTCKMTHLTLRKRMKS
ncbi:hypothetical protein Tco_1033750 [Tanacetum coccineum]